jgi:hypothetical protein
MTDYERGKQDGYIGKLVQYPNNANYMRGYNAGYAKAEQEYYDSTSDLECYGGPNDSNFDQHCC